MKKSLVDLDPNAEDIMNPDQYVYEFGKRYYSEQVRDGLCLTLILRALLDKDRQGQEQVDVYVKEILESSDMHWWLTYRHGDIISYLAEASPKTFVEYIENDLRKNDSLMKRLFAPIRKKHFFAAEYEVVYTHVLFALEMLAWMPEYLTRVSLILAQLSLIPNESNYSNKPVNSLVDIYRLWMPMTMTDPENRCQAIKRIYKSYPEVGLDLCFRLARRFNQQHVSYSPRISRWRLKQVVVRSSITYGEIYVVLKSICELMASHCEPTVEELSNMMEIATDSAVSADLRKMLREHVVGQQDILKGNKTFYKNLMNHINRFRSSPNAKWCLPDNEVKEWEILQEILKPTNLQDQLEHLFDGNYHLLPELRGVTRYEEKFKKVEELRSEAVNKILVQDGFEALINYSKRLHNPQYIMRSLAMQEDAFDYFDRVYMLVETDEHFNRIAVDYFNRIDICDRKRFLNKVNTYKNHSYVWYPLAAVLNVDDEIWNYVEQLTEQQQHDYWTHVETHVIPNSRVDYLNSHYESAGRGDQVVKVLYHMIEYKEQYSFDLNYVVNTMKRILPILDIEKLGFIRFELNSVMEWIDKQPEVADTDIVALEIPYILMSAEEINDWRIYKMIIEDPHYLFEMIDYAFYSDDPEQRKLEEERNTSDKQRRVLATFSGRLLLSIHTMPCMGEDDAIDDERLREYIATLQKLGNEKKKLSMVNHTIGQLLANCPHCIQGCPPEIVCEIIEGLNNKSVNDSFHAQIYNRLGSTVRGPFDGGDIEYNKAARFCKTAEKLQIMYPITSEIFRDLSDVYMNEAKRHDTEVEIMKLDN